MIYRSPKPHGFFIVSMYARGARRPSDCLPEFFAIRSDAYEAGAAEVARVAAIEPANRHPQIDWAVRFTIKKTR